MAVKYILSEKEKMKDIVICFCGAGLVLGLPAIYALLFEATIFGWLVVGIVLSVFLLVVIEILYRLGI